MVHVTILSQNISNYKQLSAVALAWDTSYFRGRDRRKTTSGSANKHKNQDKPRQLSETLSQKNVGL